MRLRPRHLTTLSNEQGDLAVMDRWGIARCDAVEMTSVSSELTKLLAEESPPPTDRGNLVNWICERRHAVQENRLEEAIAIATRAEAIHRRDDAWPHGLADQLIELLDCVVTHQQREQAVVFPMLLRGVDALPDRTVDEMVAAHETLLAKWLELDRLTAGFRAPAHACAAWRLLYALCYKLQGDCREQVALENRMLLDGRAARHPG
ncbi:MAG: hemerythrin domain-containing protein [Brevundimonas sp.]